MKKRDLITSSFQEIGSKVSKFRAKSTFRGIKLPRKGGKRWKVLNLASKDGLTLLIPISISPTSLTLLFRVHMNVCRRKASS